MGVESCRKSNCKLRAHQVDPETGFAEEVIVDRLGVVVVLVESQLLDRHGCVAPRASAGRQMRGISVCSPESSRQQHLKTAEKAPAPSCACFTTSDSSISHASLAIETARSLVRRCATICFGTSTGMD